MTRHGTFLLICMALVATLMVLAFAFLRVVQSAHTSGDATNRDMLAREAAFQGFQHAAENIVRGYISDAQNPGNTAFTHLDSETFAPFTSITGANYAPATLYASSLERDDVATDHRLALPMTMMWWEGYGWDGRTEGYLENDGRARFYEPSFYDFPATAANPTAPTIAVPFTQHTFTAPPDRADGLYLDEHFVRINGSSLQARQLARYRLRYAVQITDLDGAYPLNGDANLDYTTITDTDPANVADPVAKHVVRSMEVIPRIFEFMTMDGGFYEAGSSAGMRMQHIYQGRGWASNFDANAATHHVPLTFPLMYRTQAQPWLFMQGVTWLGTFWHYPPNPGNAYAEFPYAALPGNANAAGGPVGTKAGGEVWPAMSSHNAGGYGDYTMNHCLLGPAYSFYQARLSCAGGYSTREDWGAYSFSDGSGGTWEGLSQTPFSRAVIPSTTPSRYGSVVDAPMTINVMTAHTNLTTAMLAAYLPDGAMKAMYYPNNKNENTSATASIAAGAVNKIWPPYPTQSSGTSSSYPTDIEVRIYGGGGSGATATASVSATNGAITSVNLVNGGAGYTSAPSVAFLYQKESNATDDLFIPALSPAFGPGYGNYQQPQNAAAGINPDFHIFHRHPGDPGYRNPGDRYPGPLAFNGFDQNNSPWHDDLGRMIDVSDQYGIRDPINGAYPYGIGNDPYLATHFVTEQWTDISTPSTNRAGYKDPDESWIDISPVGASSTAPYNTDGVWDVDGQGPPYQFGIAPVLRDESWLATLGPHPDSFYADMLMAMSNAIAEARAMWLFYPTGTYNTPSTMFTDSNTPHGGPWLIPGYPANRVQNLHDLDALFLANLGIDINNPSATTPFTGYPNFTAGASPRKGGMISDPITQHSPAQNLASLYSNPVFFDVIHGANNLPDGTIINGSTATGAQLTSTMELMLNDFRMSFLGSSPGYQATFQALDFNGDGRVTCSSFPSNPSASATEAALHIDQYLPGAEMPLGATVNPGNVAITIASNPAYIPFSISGNFFIGKSKFYRVITRGSVYDNLRNTSVSEALLDTVLCVDPADEAQELAAPANQNPGRQYSSHVIYQRWWFDKYRGQMSRSY